MSFKMQRQTIDDCQLLEGKRPVPWLASLLTQRNLLLNITHGQPPFEVIIGVPHQAEAGISRIAEDWRASTSIKMGRPSDENAAIYALQIYRMMRHCDVSYKLIIAVHATDHDPNKDLESPYCRALFAQPAKLLFECHGSGEQRAHDLELSAGSNPLSHPDQFGWMLAQQLAGRYSLAVQQRPMSSAGLLYASPEHATKTKLKLPALMTTSLRQAATFGMHAFHIEAKPQFRNAHPPEPGIESELTPAGSILGSALAWVIHRYAAVLHAPR